MNLKVTSILAASAILGVVGGLGLAQAATDYVCRDGARFPVIVCVTDDCRVKDDLSSSTIRAPRSSTIRAPR